MRITAGKFRSRKINVPNIEGLRPTSSKVREALFNMLGDIEGWTMLDLFSGSGIMALEALSRGATRTHSIELQAKACKQLHAVAQLFQLDDQRWSIQRGELPRALKSLTNQHFDWIFADPPYDCGMAEKIPGWLQQAGISCSKLVIEESLRAQPVWPADWSVHSRSYGDTQLHFLKKIDSKEPDS